MPTLGLVIPVYNEAAMIPLLAERLHHVFNAEVCAQHQLQKVEYIFVDDGSRDDSAQLLTQYFTPGTEATIIRLSRNFGHQAALTAGLDYAQTDLVAIIDADLQDPPEVILTMLEKWREGYDVVYGLRANRKESALKRLAYWIFYRVYGLLSPIDVPLDSGDFCLLSRRVVEQLNRLPERLRFPRGLRSWVGFRQIGVVYDRPARVAGETSYTFGRLYKLATDGIASLSVRPLRLMQALAFAYFIASLVAMVILLLRLAFSARQTIEFYILAVLILSSSGITLLGQYILGAYIGRTYQEVKGRPPYIVQEVIGAEPRDEPQRGRNRD
jgi:dolichol-phosphate mannosyltransferase